VRVPATIGTAALIRARPERARLLPPLQPRRPLRRVVHTRTGAIGATRLRLRSPPLFLVAARLLSIPLSLAHNELDAQAHRDRSQRPAERRLVGRVGCGGARVQDVTMAEVV